MASRKDNRVRMPCIALLHTMCYNLINLCYSRQCSLLMEILHPDQCIASNFTRYYSCSSLFSSHSTATTQRALFHSTGGLSLGTKPPLPTSLPQCTQPRFAREKTLQARARKKEKLGDEIDDITVCHTDTLEVNVDVYRSLVLA